MLSHIKPDCCPKHMLNNANWSQKKGGFSLKNLHFRGTSGELKISYINPSASSQICQSMTDLWRKHTLERA